MDLNPAHMARLGHALMVAGGAAASVGAKLVRSHSDIVAEDMKKAVHAAYKLGRHHQYHGIPAPEELGGAAAHVGFGQADDEDQAAEVDDRVAAADQARPVDEVFDQDATAATDSPNAGSTGPGAETVARVFPIGSAGSAAATPAADLMTADYQDKAALYPQAHEGDEQA